MTANRPYRTADIPGAKEFDTDIASCRRRLHNGWQALGCPKEGATLINGIVRKMTPDERLACEISMKKYHAAKIERRVGLRRTLLENKKRRLTKTR